MLDKVATGSYFVRMRTVGIKVLKNKLSEYVRLATGGETVLVTDRDRVVAEIGPPQRKRADETIDDFRTRGAHEGWLTPAGAPRKAPLPSRRPLMPLKELMHSLDRSRDDR